MKKYLYRIIGGVLLLGVELVVWWMITWQQDVFTLGVLNCIAWVAAVCIYLARHHTVHILHLHHYWKQYWRTALITIRWWFFIKLMLIQQWLYEVVILSGLLVAAMSIEWKVLPLRRWKHAVPSWSILWILSCMTVLVIFQKHRVVESHWLIVTAFGGGWLVYAIGLLIANKPTVRDPLLITWGLLTVVAGLRAASTMLIEAYEDRIIETIVYQEKEVYLPAESCLPDWWSVSMVPVSMSE